MNNNFFWINENCSSYFFITSALHYRGFPTLHKRSTPEAHKSKPMEVTPHRYTSCRLHRYTSYKLHRYQTDITQSTQILDRHHKDTTHFSEKRVGLSLKVICLRFQMTQFGCPDSLQLFLRKIVTTTLSS